MVNRRVFLWRFGASASVSAVALSGCGTVLHRERIHRPHSRDIDWEIAALNGLGLALFFVPGVLAFVVDFHTGAIYLPPAELPANGPAKKHASIATVSDASTVSLSDERHRCARGGSRQTWRRISCPPRLLDAKSLESVIRDTYQEQVHLLQAGTRVSAISGLDQYESRYRRHRIDPEYGEPIETFLPT